VSASGPGKACAGALGSLHQIFLILLLTFLIKQKSKAQCLLPLGKGTPANMHCETEVNENILSFGLKCFGKMFYNKEMIEVQFF
jgi:hypothetical protein